MKTSLNKAFTLVELLVVITVLAILATLTYIYFTSNLAEARDAKRSTDLKEITNVLELYQTENNTYPEPSNFVNITYSGSAVAWTQWTFGKDIALVVKSFGKDIPMDPLFKNEYTYSITNKGREFQIASIYETLQEEEGLWELAQVIIPETQAASVEAAFVMGNYNGFMVKADYGNKEYFIATPSIIANDISNPDILHIIISQKLVYTKFFNIPHSYSPFMQVDGWFDFNVIDPVVYSGSSDDLKNEDTLLAFDEKLKYIYATTPTESFEKYISLLDQDGLSNIKWFLTRKFKIYFRSYFNCKDILDDGASIGDGEYTIDPDGDEGVAPYKVYCDMTTEGGWWTRVGDNHVVNGNFSGGNGITWAVANYPSTNQVVALTQPVVNNNYALHQTGNYSSYYKVGFVDPSVLKPGYEIRMSLWRSDYSSGSTSTGAQNVALMWGKNTPWTLWTCTTGASNSPSCYFTNFNRKMANSANFGSGWALTHIQTSVIPPVATVTTAYLSGAVLFDGYIPSTSNTSSYGGINTYTLAEKQAIDAWVQAGWFLVSTNNESSWDPLGEYFSMPTVQYSDGRGVRWTVQNIDHPLVNGSIGLWVDLRWRSLVWTYAHAALGWTILPDDVVIARDYYAPYAPTVLLRKHGKWHILFISDDGVFVQMAAGNTFDATDYETVFAASIMAYVIETAAGINPHEGYVFHNRIYYSDGTFSTNGEDEVVETKQVAWKTWYRELTRHKIYKTPESFDWYIGLDANNNKDLYYTWVRLELYYR